MGQKVLVTAAASGIGLEIARTFSSSGATVFVTDINEQAIEAAKKEIPGLLATLCNNGKRADIERMVPTAVAALGGLDVLVNNAGISGHRSCRNGGSRQMGRGADGRSDWHFQRHASCHSTS